MPVDEFIQQLPPLIEELHHSSILFYPSQFATAHSGSPREAILDFVRCIRTIQTPEKLPQILQDIASGTKPIFAIFDNQCTGYRVTGNQQLTVVSDALAKQAEVIFTDEAVFSFQKRQTVMTVLMGIPFLASTFFIPSCDCALEALQGVSTSMAIIVVAIMVYQVIRLASTYLAFPKRAAAFDASCSFTTD
jgi:hypothetical protein